MASAQTTAKPGPASFPNPALTVYAPGGQVFANGNAVPVTAGTTLALGTGANMEIVTVGAPSAFGGNGQTTFPVTAVLWPTPGAALTKNHYAGESVSNIVPGNPGPQPAFDFGNPKYQPVVPFWSPLP